MKGNICQKLPRVRLAVIIILFNEITANLTHTDCRVIISRGNYPSHHGVLCEEEGEIGVCKISGYYYSF